MFKKVQSVKERPRAFGFRFKERTPRRLNHRRGSRGVVGDVSVRVHVRGDGYERCGRATDRVDVWGDYIDFGVLFRAL